MKPRWRRMLIPIVSLFVVTALAFALLSYRWIISPKANLPEHANAIVLLAGGNGERLPKALELLQAGIADTLVVSLGGPSWTPHAVKALKQLCAAANPAFTVICQTASPDSTQGEAIAFSALAQENGWSKIIIVTSNYHLTRSVRWFDRCFSGQVYGAPADGPISLRHFIHEWLGLVAHATIQRSCLQRKARIKP